MPDFRPPRVDPIQAAKADAENARFLASLGCVPVGTNKPGTACSAEQLQRMLNEVVATVERAGFDEACLQVEITVTNAERRQVSYTRWVPDSHAQKVRPLRAVPMQAAVRDEVDFLDIAPEPAAARHPAVAGAVAFLATAVAHLAVLFIAARRRKVQP